MEINSRESIDLLYVFVRFVRFFKRAKKHIIFSVVIGIIIGLFYYFQKAPIYRSQLTAYSTYLNSEQVSDVMLDLDQLIGEKDLVQLSQNTNLSVEIINKVASVKCKPHITLESLKKDNSDDGTFIISVEVKDIAILDSLEKGIMYYLENNPYVKKRVKLKLQGMELELSKIGKEMNDLESLKIDMQNLLRNNSGKSNLFLQDAGNISSQVIELFQKYSGLSYDLKFASTDIRVIKSFTKFKKKVSPNFLLSIIGSIIICTIIGIIVFFSSSFLRLIKDVSA